MTVWDQARSGNHREEGPGQGEVLREVWLPMRGSPPNQTEQLPVEEPEDERVRIELTVPNTVEAPARARYLIRRVMSSRRRRDDAMLAASELTTNAVVHGAGESDDAIRLTGERDDIRLRFEVEQMGRPSVPSSKLRHSRGGRGLAIVRSLADRWGISADGEKTLAWFEMYLGRDHGGDREPA